MPTIKYFSDIDLQGVNKVINLPTPTSGTDMVSKNYVDTYLEGLSWKEEVVAASTTNVSISSPGTTLDGVTLSLNDRVLLKDQTDQTQNGIYIFDTDTTPLVRSTDADTITDLKQAVVTVSQGTINSGSTFRQETTTGTIGSANITWVAFGVVAQTATETVEGIAEIATQSEVDTGTESGAKFVTPNTLSNTSLFPKKFSTDVGDNTNTVLTVTHNLNTKDVVVNVYDNTTPFAQIAVTIEHSTVNTINLDFGATTPTTNQYRCVVIG